MPDEEKRCKYWYIERDPEKELPVVKQCPHPYFGPGKNRKGEEIDCCIFHASIDAKSGDEDTKRFWKGFKDIFDLTKKRVEAAKTDEEKKNVWLECRGFVFPDTSDRFDSREFPFSVNMISATFSSDAVFRLARFTGNAVFQGATFTGDANFLVTQFSGDAYFEFTQFSGEANFRGAQFSGIADFRGSKITRGNFYGLEIRGFDFSRARIGEFAQTAEYDDKGTEEGDNCKFQKIKTLKPVSSTDFTGVKYNAHNQYLKLSLYSFGFAFWRTAKKLLSLLNEHYKIPRFRPRKYLRTKFYYVDTSAVDWSVNRQLERDIKYQQFLRQIWERSFGTKVFYFV